MIDVDAAFGSVCHSAKELATGMQRFHGVPQDSDNHQRFQCIVESLDGMSMNRAVAAPERRSH